jgi:VanZ family protein
MDQPSKGRGKWLVTITGVVVLYWLAILIATHVPLAKSQNPGRSWDKLGHLAAFAGLSALLCLTGATLWRPSWRLYASVFMMVAAYGAMDELSQRFSPGRSSDFRDWIADLLGAGIGILCFAVTHRFAARRV